MVSSLDYVGNHRLSGGQTGINQPFYTLLDGFGVVDLDGLLAEWTYHHLIEGLVDFRTFVTLDG